MEFSGQHKLRRENNVEDGWQSKTALKLSDEGLELVIFHNVNEPIIVANDVASC
jgi:hypothetical protein